ncbi:hypothetical protein GGX14DRAFT_580545 [Mycena pura]|uniref:Uncharacterized protein n=1 Tax=Mycena pura TaxID=153505 RepID=A0AAD6Y372_9AGAR|nr:hypothetical protein GGX14DRAFT_580545 [Mycena pura]
MGRLNDTQKRADRNKILPHGVPIEIFKNAEDYGALDLKFRVRVQLHPNAIAQVRDLYAPLEQEVFQLVPPDFHAPATQLYNEISTPPPDELDEIHTSPAAVNDCWGRAMTISRDDYHGDDVELLPNLQELPPAMREGGMFYLGGVNEGRGLDHRQNARLNSMMDVEVPLPFADFGGFWGDDEVEEEDEAQVESLLTGNIE